MQSFLTPKPSSGNVQILERKPDETPPTENDEMSELEAAMQPLLKAFESKDFKAMAQAFSDAFQIADMSPHDEYESE